MPAYSQIVRRIAVLGSGITGLSAIQTIAKARRAGAPVEELLIERQNRLGGVIRTESVEGCILEAGPDSFLAEKPEAAALCRELGLGDQLMGSNDTERRTYILLKGRLVPIPDGLMFLVPTRIWPMATTPLLPFGTKLAAAAEWFMQPPSANSHHPEDESVASFVARHYGQAMVDNVADPLLSGVYGGDSAVLSVRSVLARFWEMERKYGSLTRATLRVRRERRKASKKAEVTQPAPPLFMTLSGGLEQLTERLAAFTEPRRIFTGRQALAIEPGPGGPGGETDSCARRFQITCANGACYDADAIVLAIPTHECSRLLRALNPTLGELLGGIPYSSSMTVSLGYGPGAREKLPPGFGYLVPHKEGRRMLACTFVHAKFKNRAPEDKAVLRCFLGGARDPGVLELGDEEILKIVRTELKEVLNFQEEPLFCRTHRWVASMAQYPVGHAERIRKVQAECAKLPGLFLAGNAYSGIGISDCIRTGRAAAQQALACVGIRPSGQ